MNAAGILQQWPVLAMGAMCLWSGVSAMAPPSVRQASSMKANSTASSHHDLLGQPFRAAVPSRRMVVYPPMLWDYLTLENTDRHVVAVAPYLQKSLSEMLLGDVFPGVSQLPPAPIAGNDGVPSDVEPLLQMAPDAVLVPAGFVDLVLRVGLPGVQYGTQFEREIDEIVPEWRFLALLSGKQERERWLEDRYRQSLRSVIEAAPVQTNRVKTRVLYAYGVDGSVVHVASSNRLESTALKMLGATNLGAYSHEGSLDAEELIALDADMVFLYGVNNPSPSAWYAEPAFRSLRAVRNRRVYAEPIGGSRLSGLVELPLKVRWMAELLYPNQMPSRLREDFRKTYCDVYGYRLDDSALDKALRLTENSASGGYERFSKRGPADGSCQAH